MKLEILLFFFFSFLRLALVDEVIHAAYSFDVIINEIAWMGTETSHNDEWIVLTKQRFLYL